MRGGKFAKKKSEILFPREQQDCMMMNAIEVILANTRRAEQISNHGVSNSVSTNLNCGQNVFYCIVYIYHV